MQRLALLAAAVALLFVGVTPALAQEGAPPQQQPPQQQPPQQQQEVPDVDVDDEELESIAKAYINVQNITTTYRERLNNAEDAEVAKDIQQEYADVANSAIQDEGVSLERYDTVINVAGADPELRERLVLVIEDIMNEGDGSDS